jgi:regulator of protease activity HflC (stomatin/prohibitin superfamily)
MCAFVVFFVLLLSLPLAALLLGLRRVPLGAVGVVIRMGRRTSQVKPEGTTWVWPFVDELVWIYPRERQVDIPKVPYYTTDRVRISFKTTLRVAVTNAAALLDQGPGTYKPFTHDAEKDEETNTALRGLMQNSIRETVQAMRIDEVLFGGGTGFQPALRERIRAELVQTAKRWGLGVVEVWLTEVEADDPKMKQAVEAEVREEMEGRGRLASWKAQIQKGELFNDVALQMSEKARREGRDLPLEEARSFLLGFYQNESALEVALRAAGGHNDLMSLFYLQHLGLPLPSHPPFNQGLGTDAPAPPVAALRAAPARGEAQDGSFVIGREGDIVVEGDGISRHHARLVVAQGRMSLLDLGSTNGTFVSGRKLTAKEAAPLGASDTVGLGKTVVVTTPQLAAATQTRTLRSSAPTVGG